MNSENVSSHFISLSVKLLRLKFQEVIQSSSESREDVSVSNSGRESVCAPTFEWQMYESVSGGKYSF